MEYRVPVWVQYPRWHIIVGLLIFADFNLRRRCAFAHAFIRFKRNYAILRVQIYNNYFI